MRGERSRQPEWPEACSLRSLKEREMLLSVVIPAFNEGRYLPETLSSLRDAARACRCGLELIVVDNASADRTAEIAKAFGATLAHEPIHNIARVRNTGARHARSDVLVFIDADTPAPRVCSAELRKR